MELIFFFFQAEDGIRDYKVTGVQTCALPICDKIQKIKNLQEGDNLKVLCNVYSREYNGRYFHNIDGYHFAKAGEEVEEDDNNDMPF